MPSSYGINNERLLIKKKNLINMKLNAIEIPMNKQIKSSNRRFKNSHFNTPLKETKHNRY
jgi:hypothetical protein